MKFLVVAVALGAALTGACGGDDGGDDAQILPDGPILDRLNALPGVTAEAMPTFEERYEYYVVRFTQPVDHDDPDGPTFQQEVSLLHRDETAPMVVFTTGYSDYWEDNTVEVTGFLAGNQISVEHRFFGDSRPETTDWSSLTIEQMANDEHAIIVALKQIYTGPYVTTGASKGGMTAVYHRRFFPDDVVGTIPYVAPISFGAPDARYAAHFETVGTMECREKVRALAVEMLANRRAMLETKAMEAGDSYTRVSLQAAVEASAINLEFAFWQYYGVSFCGAVPLTTASDTAVWNFVKTVSSPADSSDPQVEAFEAYYYQSVAQLGYPGGTTPYLDAYVMYDGPNDFAGVYPTGVTLPTYDGGAAMNDIDAWVQSESEQLLFIYGQWDPWTAGAFTLGNSQDSLELTVPEGTHNAQIADLPTADKNAAIAKLEAWTGVDVAARMARTTSVVARVRPPRIPPVLHVALTRAQRIVAP